MAGVWHPTITAYEVHGSRQENWNDANPSISVLLQMDNLDVSKFVRDTVDDRPKWPECTIVSGESYTPSYLYATAVEVMPVRDAHYASTETTEIIVREAPGKGVVRVTYTPQRAFKRTLTTTVGTGTATGSGYESQEIWVSYQKHVTTEFLTMDYNDFEWWYSTDQGMQRDPLKPDEAPGKYLRTIKYVMTYENVYLAKDIEDIINNYSGTVNNSSLTMSTDSGVVATFTAEQVLFNVEDVQPGIMKYSRYLGYDAYVLHYNLRCSFTCRTGPSTWNKFWRARRETAPGTGGLDDSGWKELYLKGTHQSTPTQFDPYLSTNYWYCLWV